jgi:hypothetical protein
MLEKDPGKRFASLAEVVRHFSHGCDVSDPKIRDQISALVKSGPPRRQSFPPTPVSPTPGMLKSVPPAAGAAAPPRGKGATVPSAGHPTAATPPDDAVRSAETAAVAAIGDDAHSRPTAAIDSGQHDAATVIAPSRDGHSGTTREARPAKRAPFGMIAGLVVVAGIGIAIAMSQSGAPSAPVAQSDSAAVAPTPSAVTAVDAALGDSVVVGHGPDATTPVRGKAPRTVGADAIALLNVSLGRPSLRVGDTVRARLEALDDAGERVTSPQIVWSTSRPGIVKFAGPGMLVGVREGSATITVGAAAVTGTMNVTVASRAATPPAARKKSP